MFVDYLTLVMLNLVAGLGILAYYVATGLRPNKGVAAGFGVVGLLHTVLGLHMSLTWPLPGSYNILFGEPTTLLGLVFLAAALAVAKEWDLYPTALFAFFAGVNGLAAGYAIIVNELTRDPLMSGLSFILTGLLGVLAPFGLKWKENRTFRYLALALIIVVLLLWLYAWYKSLLGHVGLFSEWVPDAMLTRQAQ